MTSLSTAESEKTITYYDQNARRFAADTQSVAFSSIQDRFLDMLDPESLILDFGCGSGRDSLYFLQKGFRVEACDGSVEMARTASALTGLRVRQMLFDELDEKERYDGIFACASILHVPSKNLSNIIRKMKKALKVNGVMYISFKYGTFEGMRNGRYFTDRTEDSLREILKEVGGLMIKSTWVTGDMRPERDGEKWLNVLLRRRA